MDSHLAVLATRAGTSRGHRTLAEKAYETLHTAIITGALRPDARLPIEELAEYLDMSPMPIREAVRRLDAVGLVDNIPHRGARVRGLSVTDLAEHARQCLHELENLTDDASAATSEAHADLHFALYEAAESEWLLRLIRPAWQVSERYALEWPQVRQLEARAAEHREILGACEAHNPDRAAEALHDHLAMTANSLGEAMGAEPLYRLGAHI
jgi:DNA-binding GntR family transcriptional regulator